MKNLIVVFFLVTSFFFISCKKSYQCDCSQSNSVNYKESSREKATTACKAKAKVSSGEDCRIVN